MIVYGNFFGLVKITGVIETQNLSFLVWRPNAFPGLGLRVFVGWLLVVPNRWKITSTYPTGDQFTERR